ncbi:MAG: hypothetical protein ACRDJO_02825 [Actinomycetota bacterium]
MNTRAGAGGLKRVTPPAAGVVLGSTAYRIVHFRDRPVLVVP